MIERYMKNYIKLPSNIFIDSVKVVLVFSLVTLGWLLFKLPEFGQVVMYIQSIVSNNGVHRKDVLMMIFFYSIPIVLYYINYLIVLKKDKNYLDNSLIYSMLLFFIVTNSGSSGEFIYFQF